MVTLKATLQISPGSFLQGQKEMSELLQRRETAQADTLQPKGQQAHLQHFGVPALSPYTPGGALSSPKASTGRKHQDVTG